MTKARRDNRRMNVLQKMAVRGLGYANSLGDVGVASPAGSTITTSSYSSTNSSNKRKMAPAAEYSNFEMDRALQASVLSHQRELIKDFRRDGL